MFSFKKIKRQLCGYLFWNVFTVSVLSMSCYTISAEELQNDATKTVQGLGSSALQNPTEPTSGSDDWKGSYIYYGTYESAPVKYRVLDKCTTDFSADNETKTLLLDCDNVLFLQAFDEDEIPNDGYECVNEWAGSDLKKVLNNESGFLYESFSKTERNAIWESTKTSENSNDGSGDYYILYAPLAGEKIFVLDLKEATRPTYGYSDFLTTAENHKKTREGETLYWWLRSRYNNNFRAVCFNNKGSLSYVSTYLDDIGVAPAFNIKLSSVLFTSTVSENNAEGSEYKLTLTDPDVQILTGENVTISGKNIVIPYTFTGKNASNITHISVLVLDKEYKEENHASTNIIDYNPMYIDSGTSEGTVVYTLPNNLQNKVCGLDYFVYIIAEDVNGQYETDYASEPFLIHKTEIKNRKEPTCGTDGYSGDTYCTLCANLIKKGEIICATGLHKWDAGVVTKEATGVKKGEKLYTCSVCKSTRKEVLAAHGPAKKGTVIVDDKGKAKYKITKSHLTKGTVAYLAPKNKKEAEVTIPSTVMIDGIKYKVTAIAKNAFKKNKYVKSVVIGKNVITISEKAFYKCTRLAEVTIPNKVKSIGKYTFYGCTKLKKLTIKTTKLSAGKIGKKAFAKTPSNMIVKVPKKKYKAYKSALVKKGVNKNAKFIKN